MDSNAVEIKGLTKRYAKLLALDDLSLSVRKGEILGYLGPNGSGKTTTIRLMLGMIKPSSGSVRIFGNDAQTQKAIVHTKIAYVPGEANLWPALTGIETLHLLAKVHGRVDLDYRSELIKRFE
ncbi:MAG: ATP-binding cassette domain-containing protein, partial [Candidatus Saccharimonadales bacterium]